MSSFYCWLLAKCLAFSQLCLTVLSTMGLFGLIPYQTLACHCLHIAWFIFTLPSPLKLWKPRFLKTFDLNFGGASQGCCLSPKLFSLYTHCFSPTLDHNFILKFSKMREKPKSQQDCRKNNQLPLPSMYTMKTQLCRNKAQAILTFSQ